MRIYAKDLNKHLDQKIEFSGFVDSIRNLQWVQFVIVKDLTGKVQVTIEKSEEKNKEMVELIESLPLESTVKITGKLISSPKVKLNGMEIIPEKIEVTSKSEHEIPFNYKNIDGVNLDTRLDYRFIDLRSEKNQLMFMVQSSFIKYMREYLYNNNFIEIHTPKLIGAASESGAEVFEVKYFDRKAYLAQSPQFYKQMAMASGLEKIFEVANIKNKEKLEITIEVNPGTVTKEKLQMFKNCGINRLSIGLQSTNDELLKQLGRIHNYNQFLDTYIWAKEVGFENINVDLMLGIPNQRIEDLKDSLEKIVNLKPKHISLFG